jgi:hypothetical protein
MKRFHSLLRVRGLLVHLQALNACIYKLSRALLVLKAGVQALVDPIAHVDRIGYKTDRTPYLYRILQSTAL